jgi:hypothetical protein
LPCEHGLFGFGKPSDVKRYAVDPDRPAFGDGQPELNFIFARVEFDYLGAGDRGVKESFLLIESNDFPNSSLELILVIQPGVIVAKDPGDTGSAR